MSNLKQAGFIYKGQNIYFETEKPRWEALTILQRDIRETYKSFDKRCRNKINKALKCGIEIYRDEQKDLTLLYDLLLKEIIQDLFDIIKSKTKSYESVDYVFKEQIVYPFNDFTFCILFPPICYCAFI